jgi:hypothetical protein
VSIKIDAIANLLDGLRSCVLPDPLPGALVYLAGGLAVTALLVLILLSTRKQPNEKKQKKVATKRGSK